MADTRNLATALGSVVRGEVLFDDGSRALYATDASNYRQAPIGVVFPRDRADVEAAVAVCREHGAPVLGRGAGTSLAGQCCNEAVVFDFTRYMNRVLSIDAERRTARVEPGVVLDDLRDQAAEHGLTFGPDPATHRWCTLGGMIGNNSCGVHSVQTGRTSDNIERLRVLLYDGTVMDVGATDERELERRIAAGGREGRIYADLKELRDRTASLIRERYPTIPRRVSGYNLDELLPENGFHVARSLVGSEGTCGIVLEAEVRLVPAPGARALLVLGYDDVYDAADRVPEVLPHEPIGLEGMDDRLVGYMRRKGLHVDSLHVLPEGRGWLLVEFGGDDEASALQSAERARDALANGGAASARVITDSDEAELVWTIRESGLGATAFVPGMASTWEGWEDAAVEPSRLGDYLREFRDLLERYEYEGALYGHFGDGCIHTRIDFDLATREGIETFRSFIDEAADLVVRYGGSLSGEHGDGQSRAALLPKMFGSELVDAFRAFRAIWDPEARMNPGKVVDAFEPDENLRLGTAYRPRHVETAFRFPEDGGDFARATLRCVGVGKCRRTDEGIMCPSYQVTREEKHSTRGRAHLLHEMMRGDDIHGGWRSEHVKDALDLCLACKGCKGECPVQVDVATYKAEFLSHYYDGRLRPPAAYTMGLIHRWARLASFAPGLANATMNAPGLGGLIKRLGGIAPERDMPRFARRTFRDQAAERLEASRAGNGHARGRDRVLLWADTFTNHFEPRIGLAALDVLERLGYDVDLAPSGLCCGRPLYDWGMLDRARRQLAEIVEALGPEVRRGTPIVALEPSCASVFRDELPNLFDGDPDARRLGEQTFTLAEFLEPRCEELPELGREALLQGHCHERSVLRFGAARRVLGRVLSAVHEPDSGCCGMAGSFGFERENYDVSQACAERVLLPEVRATDSDTLLVADGFSCRQQIEQNTGRTAMHLAEVLSRAYREGGAG